MLVWELLGALVGAGFASGREIASFFARYGGWGYAGVCAAVGVIIWLGGTNAPEDVQKGWITKLWRMTACALLIATGGAMLSGAGEITKLLLPVSGANRVGEGFTLFLACWLAFRTEAGLAWVSGFMAATMICIVTVGLLSPAEQAAVLEMGNPQAAFAKAVCYGGFNAALLQPVLTSCKSQSERLKRKALVGASILFLLLMLAGVAVLLRQPLLMMTEMPYIQLMQGMGRVGYFISAAGLYLAILSTLTACIRALESGWMGCICIAFVSLIGFDRVVEYVYTSLGAACAAVLLLLKFLNCSGKSFISQRDML